MTSMLYTMGMALDRAAQNGFSVSLLVEGTWLEGQVAASDGVGVVLESTEGFHSVVKTDRIAAVQVHADSPYQVPIGAGAGARVHSDWTDSEAMPMPGPRTTTY